MTSITIDLQGNGFSDGEPAIEPRTCYQAGFPLGSDFKRPEPLPANAIVIDIIGPSGINGYTAEASS